MRGLTSRLAGPIAALLAGGALAGAQDQPPVFTAEDMLDVRTFAGGQPVALAPSGRWIAYVLTDLADEWNIQEPRPTGHLAVQPISGGAAGPLQMLTTGAVHAAWPAWAPDGRRLAYVRDEAGGARLVVWDAETARTMPLGEAFTARVFLPPQWDAAGRHVFIAVPVPDPPPSPPARVRIVESTDRRVPGDRVFVDERRAVLTSFEVTSGRSVRVTPDPVVLRSFSLAPDGRHLLYVAPSPDTLGVIGKERNDTFVLPLDGAGAARGLPAGARYSWSPDGRQVVFVRDGGLLAMPPEGGAARPLVPGLHVPVGEPVWAPDGSRFATLVPDPSVEDPEVEPVPPGMYTIAQPFMDLYLVSIADGSARNLTSAFDDQVSDPVWSADGSALLFRAVNNRTYDETIYRYRLDGGKLEVATSGQESYGRLAAAPGVVTLSVEDATRPPDLWAIDVRSGARRRVTDLNPQLAGFRFSKPELFSFYNADGERLGALLYKPAMRPGETVPVVTWVYEKMTPGVHRFNARDQMVISHGYAMLMPNVKVKVGRTADSFLACAVPAVNAVRAMGFTNGRFGLWGHSFGAYAVSNLITRTDVFAAAVSGATPPELFRNWASGRDRDSRNIETGQARMGGSPFEYPERYLSQSAFFHLDQVHTPVLILHGEKDVTILFGEGEMMFYALRQLGKTASFVAYANGDHSLSRHSRADALDVNHRILEWFDRYLKGAAAKGTPP